MLQPMTLQLAACGAQRGGANWWRVVNMNIYAKAGLTVSM